MDALRSRRLLLEPVTADDLGALHAHWSEPDVRRYLWDGRVVSPEEVEDAIGTSVRLFAERRVGLWRVGVPGEAGLIGCGGFWYFHEPPELELVLSLARDRWGQGLGREAAGVFLDYAFDVLQWPAVQASADAPNAASLGLMRRLGMRRVGGRPGEFGTIEVYRITAADWRAGARGRGHDRHGTGH